MAISFHMRFVEFDPDAASFVGALPRIMPATGWPKSPNDHQELVFLAQFSCDFLSQVLRPGAIIQIFQSSDSKDAWPYAFLLEDGQPRPDGVGRKHDEVIPYTVLWEMVEEPDFFEDRMELLERGLANSKCGGLPAFDGSMEPGDKFLLQLKEAPANFNFGTFTVVVVLDASGWIRADLA